jgi:hypothetical protein
VNVDKSEKRANKVAAAPKKTRYCIVVRHGQRCDLTEEFMHMDKGKGDACLTPDGMQ